MARGRLKYIAQNILGAGSVTEQASQRWRLRLIQIALLFTVVGILIRFVDLAFTSKEQIPAVLQIKEEFSIRRKDIVDRNGALLATNIPSASLYAHPQKIINCKETASQLANVLGGVSLVIEIKLCSKQSFIWLKRHVTPQEQQAVHNLGIPGLYFSPDERRFYPQGNLFSHIIGYVDIDSNGIAGLERSYNEDVQSKIITTTLDVNVQDVVREELQSSIDTHKASGGSGIVMNANTGEIVAMVSLPDFDPHHLIDKNATNMFNKATLGVQEMGSVFKVFTVAMALDSNKVTLNDSFDVSKPVKIGRFTIHDYKGKGGNLLVHEILMYSSNLGALQIAKRVGVIEQKEYFKKLGFFSQVEMDLPEIGKPIYPQRQWNEANLMTASYGHGIAVSPLHVVQAMSAVVNGGLLSVPVLVKSGKDGRRNVDQNVDHKSRKRIFKAQTSEIMKKLLRLTVKEGRVRKANIEEYLVGGKTGTPELLVNGKYSHKLNTAVFVGAFPIDKPEYVVFVAVEDPKPNEINGGYATGGMIAAPLGGAIIRRVGPLLGLPHQNPRVQESSSGVE